MHQILANVWKLGGVSCLMLTALVGCHDASYQGTIKAEYQRLASVNDIQPLTKPLVKPILYTQVVSLKGLPTTQQKQKFIDLMLPAILVAKFNLDQKHNRIKHLTKKGWRKVTWTPDDSTFVQTELQRYQATNISQLEKKIKPHPASLVLAQAALESGWGTSGFFLEANNVFGVWSFREDEDRIETSARRGKQKVYLRRYDNLSLSIEDYYETIGRVPAYRTFRKKRFENENPYALLPQLHAYSELGRRYTKRLRAVIHDNRLTRYDKYRIDPAYIQNNANLVAGNN
ncbi:MAG: glucosaminidase domain-containing protein [Bacteroidota bacterium]